MSQGEASPPVKKGRLEIISRSSNALTTEEQKAVFEQVTTKHPFVDKVKYPVMLTNDAVVKDGTGEIVAVLIKKAFPEAVAEKAANVLRSNPKRTSLRASIFGGESPYSGIAGYYDYNGSPTNLKCRKTSFTCEAANKWNGVFPFVEYIAEQYKRNMPRNFTAQDAAIPDVVRIHGSPFSTLTINQRFRTAKHTDAGDFDAGFGVLTVLEGNYKGMHLGMPELGVCFAMEPCDALLFNTHHWHCNTELEQCPAVWERLTCVLYYRVALGDHRCIAEYQRRLENAKANGEEVAGGIESIVGKENGENSNKAAVTVPVELSPLGVMLASADLSPSLRSKLATLHVIGSDTSTALDAVVVEAKEAALAAAVKKLHPMFTKKKMQKSDASLKKDDPRPTLLRCLFGRVGDHCKGNSDAPSVQWSGRTENVDRFTPFQKARHGGQVHAVQPRSGGFSEGTIPEQRHLLTQKSLSELLLKPLLKCWLDARDSWKSKVLEDWNHQVAISPGRTDFSWKNKGAMSAAFFDFCEVGEQVMLDILEKEEATSGEKNSFWAVFALHCFVTCSEDLKMPDTAMSMRKLNVKLKDFSYGGTRYLKDMPEEEQERRRIRKLRLEKTRREGDGEGEGDGNGESASWLVNDTFDYQSEEQAVNFAELGIPLPAEYVDRSIVESVAPINGLPTGNTRVLVVTQATAGAPPPDCTALIVALKNFIGSDEAEENDDDVPKPKVVKEEEQDDPNLRLLLGDDPKEDDPPVAREVGVKTKRPPVKRTRQSKPKASTPKVEIKDCWTVGSAICYELRRYVSSLPLGNTMKHLPEVVSLLSLENIPDEVVAGGLARSNGTGHRHAIIALGAVQAIQKQIEGDSGKDTPSECDSLPTTIEDPRVHLDSISVTSLLAACNELATSEPYDIIVMQGVTRSLETPEELHKVLSCIPRHSKETQSGQTALFVIDVDSRDREEEFIYPVINNANLLVKEPLLAVVANAFDRQYPKIVRSEKVLRDFLGAPWKEAGALAEEELQPSVIKSVAGTFYFQGDPLNSLCLCCSLK